MNVKTQRERRPRRREEEGRDEGNLEEVMNVGEAGAMMNPPIFWEKKRRRVGSSGLQLGAVKAIMCSETVSAARA